MKRDDIECATKARTFRARMRKCSRLLAVLGLASLPAACVQHPTVGVSDETETTSPWDEFLRIAGALAVPDGTVEIEVAMDKDGTEFEPLGITRSGPDPIVDPSFPEFHPWERSTRVPQRYWFRGVSGGSAARLRAWFRPEEGSGYLLGTAEVFNTRETCVAVSENPNAFQSLAMALATACLTTPSSSDLTFTFKTSDYNDHCGEDNEACCTVGAPCMFELECKSNNRCGPPEREPSPSPPGDSGGVNDDEKCTNGEVQLVTFSPEGNGCDPGFSVNGYRECSNGKFGEPKAAYCNSGAEAPAGTECYCAISGGACGIGRDQPCGGVDPPSTRGLCVPGAGCAPLNGPQGQGQWLCLDDPVARDVPCWKPSDVVDVPPLDPTYPDPGDPKCEVGTPDDFDQCCVDDKKDSFNRCITPVGESSGSGGSPSP